MSRHRRTPRRRPALWALVGLAFLLLGVVLWVGIRGLLARDELMGAVPLVEELKTSVVAGDTTAAAPIADAIADRAGNAAALTSDPIWRGLEWVPGVGPNLIAFREAAAVVETVADDALPPLADLLASLDFQTFLPHDSRFDVAAIEALGTKLSSASEAMAGAVALADGIDTDGTIPQIADAVTGLVGTIDEAGALIAAVNGTVQVLPAMLGADGPRSVLVLVQNNAELRGAGGIPGAIIELRTEDGRLELARHASTSDFEPYAEPVLPITERERTLYTDRLVHYVQNATNTPDFARAAEISSAMWRETFGGTVDAVFAVDPVALSYVLEATGPVTLPDGTELTAENAVETLLSDVYARFPAPEEQDAYFAAAAAAVFDAVTTAPGDPQTFIAAIGRGVGERRILGWSADPAEQAVIASGGPIATLLPEQTADASGIGVYFADNTAGKMDWYLRPSIEIGAIGCRADDRTYFRVGVGLDSLAPSDAATSLPEYVTGVGLSIEEPGDILTSVSVYFPPGTLVYGVTQDGAPRAFFTAPAGPDEPTAVVFTVYLTPGQSSEVVFEALGPTGAPPKVRLVHTPTAFPVETTVELPIACPSFPTNPADDPVDAAGVTRPERVTQLQ